jgi:hypothetical protein
VRTIEFLTRSGCGLCHDALPRVRLICRLLGRKLEVVDIAEDPHLEREFASRIPVLRSDGGLVLAEGTLSWKQSFLAVRKA